MVEGVDIVVSCVGTTGRAKNPIVEKSVRSLLSAMKGSNAKLIFLSSTGIGESIPQGENMASVFGEEERRTGGLSKATAAYRHHYS